MRRDRRCVWVSISVDTLEGTISLSSSSSMARPLPPQQSILVHCRNFPFIRSWILLFLVDGVNLVLRWTRWICFFKTKSGRGTEFTDSHNKIISESLVALLVANVFILWEWINHNFNTWIRSSLVQTNEFKSMKSDILSCKQHKGCVPTSAIQPTLSNIVLIVKPIGTARRC